MATRQKVVHQGNSVVRIEITSARRRHLSDMAGEAGISADELASRLLSDLIDDDAAAHAGEKVTA